MKKKISISGSSGVALVVVLWAVTLISAAMLGLAALLQRQLGQEVAGLQNARAILVAESGIQMVLNPGINRADVEQASSQLSAQLSEAWKVNGKKVKVRFEVKPEDFVGEEGRLNLNFWLRPDNQQQGRRILQNLFASWDIDLNTQLKVIDALQDWVDGDSMPKAQGAEREQYMGIKKTGPRNGPFERLEEVEKVMGWPELARQAGAGTNAVDWHRKFTVFGSGKLSLLTADQDVIEAVLGMTSGKAKSFMLARKGPDGAEGTADDQVNSTLLGVDTNTLAERTSTGSEDLWRVTSTGYIGEAKRTIVALISRNPPQIKARWMEDKKP